VPRTGAHRLIAVTFASVVGGSAVLLAEAGCNAIFGTEYPELMGDDGPGLDVSTTFDADAADAGDLATDPHNCGSLRHDCLGGSCIMGRCQPVPIAVNQGWANETTLAGGNVCWFADYPSGPLRCVSRTGTCDGGGCRALANSTDVPYGITLAPDGWLYWSDQAPCRIGDVMRALPEGGAPIAVYAAPDWPSGLFATNSHLYWCDRNGPEWMHRAPLVGVDAGPDAGVEVLASGGLKKDCTTVFVDGPYVYWNDFSGDTIYRSLLSQLPCIDESCTWLHPGRGPELFFSDTNYLYVNIIGTYGAARDGSIVRIPKSCNSLACIETLADQLADPVMTMDAMHPTAIYWTDYEDATMGTLRRLPVGQKCTGTACELLLSGAEVLGNPQVDGNVIYYWSRHDQPGGQKGQASIMRLAL
jgi:hypothetical protein